MIELPGNKLNGLPLGNLELVNELLDFDGNPMVVHYTNSKGDDILGYWIDFDRNVIRWLFVKVSKRDLFLYLSARISLKSILENPKSEYIFFSDIEPDGRFIGFSMITYHEIPEKYMPKENSFYRYGVSDYYENYLSEIKFHQDLQDRSYVLKGEPSNKSHGNLLSAKDGAFVLESVSKSSYAYVTIKAKNKYKHKYGNEARVKRVSKAIADQLTPLISHAVIDSFEVWLAMDTITMNNVDEIGSEIKAEIIEGYKRDVLDVDFTSEEDAKIICEKYDAVERKKIYGPILDILEDENINIIISDRQKLIRETGKPIKASSAFTDLVIPKPTIEELKEELERKNQIYTLVLSLKEGTDISRLSKKQILDNLLLFGNDIEVPYKLASPINIADKSFDLKKPLVGTLKISDEDDVEIIFPHFQMNVKGKDIQQLNDVLREQFLNFVMPYLEEKKTDEQTISIISEYLDFNKYKLKKNNQ